jgi:hypothetical protein
MAADTSGHRQTADCCYNWVKSDANRNPPTADDPNLRREPSGLRHSTDDSPSHCRTLAERDRGRWHCPEPTNCVRRSTGDWPMHCHSR